MTPRILLHAMTFKRDFGFVYCLSKVLEGLGCKAIVCSNTDYRSWPLRQWRPDVVFFITIGRTDSLRLAYPHTNLVLWNAESGRLDTYPPFELQIAGDERRYRSVSRVLLWGGGVRELILKHARENRWSWVTDHPAEFDRKFVAVGHPRMDLARYGIRKREGSDKVRIGFIGLCPAINHNRFAPIKALLDVQERVAPGEPKEEMYFEAKYFDLITRLIQELGTDHHTFSIRPYPLENVANYRETNLVKSGRLAVDDSIEFTSWVKEQDLVIGAVSTTMYQIAASGKSYINVDQLLDRPMGPRCFANEYLAAIPEHCPRTREEFLHMVRNWSDYRLTVKPGTILARQVADHLSSGDNAPVLFQMARQIIGAARENPSPHGWPTGLAFRMNDLHCRYAVFRGEGRKPGNYSHFDRETILPKAAAEFGPVIEEVLAAVTAEQRGQLHG